MTTWITIHGMISLIINADDLGCNPDRDRGILEAFRRGIVTTASLMANGSSFSSAVKQVKEVGMPVGVHLNLAEGTPLAGRIEGLTERTGQLPGKQKLRQYLAAESCNTTALRTEFKTQIERLLDAGLQPDHLDSHQHCQLFPTLTTMITELAREYGIRTMRTSLPAEPASQDPDGPLGQELALYRQLGPKAHATILAAGLRTPDGLLGMPLLNRLNRSNLCQLLEDLPTGCWELMTHPGYACATGREFDGPQRHRELQALLAPEIKAIINRRKIRLCSFGDLSCAS